MRVRSSKLVTACTIYIYYMKFTNTCVYILPSVSVMELSSSDVGTTALSIGESARVLSLPVNHVKIS